MLPACPAPAACPPAGEAGGHCEAGVKWVQHERLVPVRIQTVRSINLVSAPLPQIHQLVEQGDVVKPEWNGYNVLHDAASRVAALDIGFLPSASAREVRCIGLGANMRGFPKLGVGRGCMQRSCSLPPGRRSIGHRWSVPV